MQYPAQKLTKSQADQLRVQLIKAQGNRCAICEANLDHVGGRPCLDHDHETGLIRGVLCSNCNGIEGQIRNLANRAKRFNSIPEWVKSLMDYWEWHKNNPSKFIYPLHKTKEQKADIIKQRRKNASKSSKSDKITRPKKVKS